MQRRLFHFVTLFVLLLSMLAGLVNPVAASEETPPPPAEEPAETPDPAEWAGERPERTLPGTEGFDPPGPGQWVSAAEAIDSPLPAYDEELLLPEAVEWLGAWDTVADYEPAGGTWFGRNLIANGGGELPWNGSEFPGWTQLVTGMWVMSNDYSPANLVTLTDLGPTSRGARYFTATPVYCYPGGAIACKVASVSQTIHLAGIEAVIDTNQVSFHLSGYFGGVMHNDTARLTMVYLDAHGSAIPGQSVTIGNVSSADRLNKRGMLYRSASGHLPEGTRSVRLTLDLVVDQPHASYYWQTALADNLSLVLNGPRVFIPLVIGSGSQQAVAQPAKPAAPSNLAGAVDGVKGLKLTWQDNATNETGYRLERKRGGETNYAVLAYLDADQTTYTDSGLAPDSQAAYRLLAYNAAGDSPAATLTAAIPAATTKPNKPASCWISNLSPTSLDFFWTDSSDNEEFFTLIYQYNGTWLHVADIEPNATNITIIDLEPGKALKLGIAAGNSVFDPISPFSESNFCVAAFITPSETGGIKVMNNASYPIAYLTINGVQQYPASPMGLLSGTYLQFNLPPGAYQVEARTGFWQDQTHRFDLYTYRFTANVTAGNVATLKVEDIPITNLLTQFNQSGTGYGYWEGFYWSNLTCRTAAFRFYPNETYDFYLSNVKKGSGTYSLVQRMPSIFGAKFAVSGVAEPALLLETYGYFFLKNGPAGWNQIEYYYKPQGYVANPFCP